MTLIPSKEFRAMYGLPAGKPDRKKPQHLESELQKACISWFRLQYPQYAMLLFAIPNGGSRKGGKQVLNKKTGKKIPLEAAIMKAEGVVSGVADLMLAVPRTIIVEIDEVPDFHYTRTLYHGLFIEMKAGKGTQSDNQIAFQKAVEAQGYKYVVCRTFEQFQTVITEYIKKP